MILRHSTYANVKYYKTTITILILLFSIINAKERECKDGKLSLLSPIQGDIIQSKNNEFNIQWNVRDDDNNNKHRAKKKPHGKKQSAGPSFMNAKKNMNAMGDLYGNLD